MKLQTFYEQSPKDYQRGEGFDPDDAYKDVDWEKIEREKEEREENEARKVLRIEGDGERYRIVRSLVNGHDVDQVTTLEGMFPLDRDDLVITLQGLKNLKNLKGLPSKVGQLIISNCGLTSMEGCPTYVKHYMALGRCDNLKIDKLPESVGGELKLFNIDLPSIDVLPRRIAGDLDMKDVGLMSLKGIHKHLKFEESAAGGSTLTLMGTGNLHDVLGVLLMDNLYSVSFGRSSDSDDVEALINDFIEEHRGSKVTVRQVMEMQDKLIDEGYEDYAGL